MSAFQILQKIWRAIPMTDRMRWWATRAILWPVLPFIQGSKIHAAYLLEMEYRRHRIRPLAGDPLPALPEPRKPDIFFWGNIDWRFRFQRPQHLALGLAAAGHRVFYVAPSFVKTRSAGFELDRIDEAGSNCIYAVHLHLDSRPRIYAARPTDADSERIREGLALLLQWTRSQRCWSVIQHPYWSDMTQWLPNANTLYDCIDHHMGFSNMGADMEALEVELLQRSDAVAASSQGLAEMAATHNGRVRIIRNAAEYDFFSRPPADVYRDPQGRRIIGYYGAIADWIDVELLRKVAERFADCLLLLIGNDTCGARGKLGDLQNVVLTGEVPYRALPGYLYGMDVCLLPFRVIPLTLATNPVKAYEYLSAGKPVVGVALPELAQFGDLIASADTHAGFLDAIAHRLSEPSNEAAIAARRVFAAANTWAERVESLESILREIPEPPVSVIVVTYNNLELTRRCLDSLECHTDYANLEIIVVDNASSDGTPEFLRHWRSAGPRRSIILNPDNKGFAAANNQGLAQATGDYFVLLNNDTEVTPGWVRTLMRHLQRDPQLGMVGPVTNNIGNEAKVPLRYGDTADMHRVAATYTLKHMGLTFPIRTLAFFCAMLPRRIYERVGPLDEAFGIGFFEDDDYCRRIEQAGFKLACAEDVFIHHHLSASFNKLGKGRQALLEKNRAIYEAKWGPWIPHRHR